MAAAQAIVRREGVEGLLGYTARALMTRRQVRAYRDRPARQESEVFFEIEVRREERLIEEKKREMGWQVYGTNALTLTLPQAVWAYRGQYRGGSRKSCRARCREPPIAALADRTSGQRRERGGGVCVDATWHGRGRGLDNSLAVVKLVDQNGLLRG
jgi:hypothetical protein